MTKIEFIEKYRHLLGGMVADAALTRRDGAELALSLRMMFSKIDGILSQIFDSLVEKKPLPANGAQAAKPRL